MIPYVREIQFEYGACDQVSPLIRRVVANNPGPFTYLGTGTYIIGKGEVAVIDPGPDLPEHLDALMAALEGEKWLLRRLDLFEELRPARMPGRGLQPMRDAA